MDRPDSPDKPNTDVIQGTLDMLILKTLSLEPMHGFGIARRVEQASRGVFKENSRRAKIYTLTRAGRKQLDIETTEWTRRASAIARLLKAEA